MIKWFDVRKRWARVDIVCNTLFDTRCYHIFTASALKINNKFWPTKDGYLLVIFCYHRHRFSFGSSTLLLLLFVASLCCGPLFCILFCFCQLTDLFFMAALCLSCLTSHFLPLILPLLFDQVPQFSCPPLCMSPFCVCCVGCAPCVMQRPWLCVFCLEVVKLSSDCSLVSLVSEIFFHIDFWSFL